MQDKQQIAKPLVIFSVTFAWIFGIIGLTLILFLSSTLPILTVMQKRLGIKWFSKYVELFSEHNQLMSVIDDFR